MEGRGRALFPESEHVGGDSDRSAFPLTIREILRRRRLTETAAEEAAALDEGEDREAEAGAATATEPVRVFEPRPATEREDEIDRLRAENDRLRLRAESAERQLRGVRRSKSTRWNPVAVLPHPREPE